MLLCNLWQERHFKILKAGEEGAQAGLSDAIGLRPLWSDVGRWSAWYPLQQALLPQNGAVVVRHRFMEPVDAAKAGALEDPAAVYADVRASVERGMVDLQVWPHSSPCSFHARLCAQPQDAFKPGLETQLPTLLMCARHFKCSLVELQARPNPCLDLIKHYACTGASAHARLESWAGTAERACGGPGEAAAGAARGAGAACVAGAGACAGAAGRPACKPLKGPVGPRQWACCGVLGMPCLYETLAAISSILKVYTMSVQA